jgi:hypothetical protein
MVTFFLILSLIFNILAFLAIINLYLRQNRFIQLEKKQEKMMQELEEVMSTFMLEIKEENEQFMNRLQQIGTHKDDEEKKSGETSEPNSSKHHIKRKQTEHAFKIGKAASFQAVKAYKKNVYDSQKPIKKGKSIPLTDDSFEIASANDDRFLDKNQEIDQKDDDVKSLLYEAILLQKKGLSLEDIAKKLNKGKTEIELLLKFHHQNEQE